MLDYVLVTCSGAMVVYVVSLVLRCHRSPRTLAYPRGELLSASLLCLSASSLLHRQEVAVSLLWLNLLRGALVVAALAGLVTLFRRFHPFERRPFDPENILRTREAGAQLVKALVDHHGDHGRYPESLRELLKDGRLESIPQPSAGAPYWKYHRRAESFVLTTAQPLFRPKGPALCYRSADHRWELENWFASASNPRPTETPPRELIMLALASLVGLSCFLPLERAPLWARALGTLALALAGVAYLATATRKGRSGA